MSKHLSFGAVIWANFPFQDCAATKKRLVMVLADLGQHIVAAYVTTNQEIAGINVGAIVEARTAVLVPNRYAIIDKRDVYWSASERSGAIARINLAKHREAAAIVRSVILIARNNGYGRFGDAVLATLHEAVRIADTARQHQEDNACRMPISRSPFQRHLPPKTSRISQLSAN